MAVRETGRSATAPPVAGRRRRPAWWGGAVAVGVVGWGTNQFTPMVVLYQTRLDFSPTLVHATFALYAVGLVPGLLVAGPLSDRVGRRRTVLAALALSMVAGAVLAGGAHGVAWLALGRLLVGLASGSAFSAGVAWIRELSAPPHDDAAPGAGALRSSAAMTLGFGLGPLVAGALAQWGPAPATVPYLPHLLLTAGALPLVARTPETVRPRPPGAGPRPPAGHDPGRARFVRVVLPLAPWVFGSVTIAMAYAPGLVSARVPGFAVAFAALVTVCTALSAVAVTPLARRLDGPGRPRLLVAGLVLVTVGLLVESGATALRHPGAAQPALALVAAALLGAGYGFCLVFGTNEAGRLARPGGLARTTGVFQACAYAGYVAPYALSLLDRWARPPLLLLTAAALAAATLAFTLGQARLTAPTHDKEPV